MTQTNATTNSVANPSAYRDAVLALVGSQDPVSILEELLDAVTAAIVEAPAEKLQLPEAPGKWSTIQVVQHLADTELVFGWRVRLILTDDRPVLQGYDENVWMSRLHGDDASLDDALAQVTVLRRELLRLLRSCTPADFARVGVHTERGEESLGLLVQLIAGHDLVHRRQLGRIAAAVR